MSLTELQSAVRVLPRRDKSLLVRELIAELAQEEGVTAIDYPSGLPMTLTALLPRS